MRKTLKIQAFGKVFLYLNQECYSWVSAFWYLRNFSLWLLWNYKTLIIQVFRNVLWFPSIECFASIFAFFVGNRLKNSQNMPFWQCYSISSYWFVCIRFSVFLRKTLKRQVLSDFVLVFGLVHNSPKKKLKLTFLIIFFYHIIALNFPEFWHLGTYEDE